MMKRITSPAAMTRAVRAERTKGNSIGFVPTLGALHAGHEALIKRARKENAIVVVSTFVNPLQFRADAYRKYPRNRAADRAICAKNDVDYLFVPTAKTMYPDGFDTKVEVGELVNRLEGKSIRWHFRGVTTVVAKLFTIVEPDRAYFGKKDPHQLALLRRMTTDLNYAVKLVGVNTQRQKDGVALSSRNTLLTPEEREATTRFALYIRQAATAVREGTNRATIEKNLFKKLTLDPGIEPDFVALVDEKSLQPDVFAGPTLIYAAVFIGGKRLTDCCEQTGLAEWR